MQIKAWLYSKTLWVAILQGVAGVIAALVIDHPTIGGLMIVKSIIDISLRLVTYTKIQ
jgi:hypothetical protein